MFTNVATKLLAEFKGALTAHSLLLFTKRLIKKPKEKNLKINWRGVLKSNVFLKTAEEVVKVFLKAKNVQLPEYESISIYSSILPEMWEVQYNTVYKVH